MKLEDQVCSLELAKRLKELGVKQESAFYWFNVHWEEGREPRWCLIKSEEINSERWRTPKNGFCAFTVAELGEMLPTDYRCEKWEYVWWMTLLLEKHHHIPAFADIKEADARAKMLIHLIEKGIIKP